MKKFLKIVAAVFFSLISLVLMFYVYASYQVDQRLQTEYMVIPQEFPIPTDSLSWSNGKHLVDIKGCADCHGADLGGQVFHNDILVGKLAAPNLTRGAGGIPPDYSTGDWVRALKHGLDRNNHPLVIMPCVETSKMSEEDMKSMIAYLKSLPPVDNTVPKSKLGLMVTALASLNQVDVIPAEKIDHQQELIKSVDKSSPLQFGKYLSSMCSGCHRDHMKGGPPLAPGFPPVPDLTSTGATGRWTQQEFNTTLRTGTRPDGSMLDPNMPWQMTKHYSDEELQALYTYFRSL